MPIVQNYKVSQPPEHSPDRNFCGFIELLLLLLLLLNYYYYYYHHHHTIFDYPLQDDVSAGFIYAAFHILCLNIHAKAEHGRLALTV
jgi:hypothetical protein